jgi:hypothetical protein
VVPETAAQLPVAVEDRLYVLEDLVGQSTELSCIVRRLSALAEEVLQLRRIVALGT